MSAVLVGLVLIGVAVAQLNRDAPARAKAIPLVNVGTVPTFTSGSSLPASTASKRPAHDAGHPIPVGARLTLGRLDVDAPIVHVGLVGNVMDVPRDPHDVGWWSAGAAPASDQGTVVIVGHINYAGVSGALSVLPESRPGDIVELVEGSTTIRYRMVAVHSYPKTVGIPADVFSRTGSPRLVLITCGGPFDSNTGNYTDNIVGYAEPL
jgi:hypothetical protein